MRYRDETFARRFLTVCHAHLFGRGFNRVDSFRVKDVSRFALRDEAHARYGESNDVFFPNFRSTTHGEQSAAIIYDIRNYVIRGISLKCN